MTAIETLISVLCDPEGKCCISGSDDDRRLIDSALADIAQAAQSADSVPAVSDLPPLPAPDLRDVGTKPQEIKEFLKGYATEYARTAIAARAPADSVQEDAARYRWLRERSSTMFVNISINGEGAEIAATLDSAVDAARKQGGA